jgi:RHS repeat-associated protein
VDVRLTAFSTVGNTFGWHGLPRDPETGLIYARHRYYDPELGRFISTDPLGYVDGPNLYAFAGNDPVNFTDPLGLYRGTPEEVAAVQDARREQRELQEQTAEAFRGACRDQPFEHPCWASGDVTLRKEWREALVAQAREKRTEFLARCGQVPCIGAPMTDEEYLEYVLEQQAIFERNRAAAVFLAPKIGGDVIAMFGVRGDAGRGALVMAARPARRPGRPPVLADSPHGQVQVFWPSSPHTNRTAGHWEAIVAQVNQMVASGAYSRIYINKGIRNEAPGVFPNRRPDVFGVRREGGRIDQTEVPSKSDSHEALIQRMMSTKGSLDERGGDIQLVPTKPPGS